MKRIVTSYICGTITLLSAISGGLASDNKKTTASVGAGGEKLPTGSWHAIITADFPKNFVTITDNVTITPDGTGHYDHATEAAYKPGYHFGAGKFNGLHKISWKTASTYKKVVRIKDEIYCYLDAQSPTRLIAANPPGYTLADYETLGGIGPPQKNDSHVTIFKIEGRNLVLETSDDKRRYVLTPGTR